MQENKMSKSNHSGIDKCRFYDRRRTNISICLNKDHVLDSRKIPSADYTRCEAYALGEFIRRNVLKRMD